MQQLQSTYNTILAVPLYDNEEVQYSMSFCGICAKLEYFYYMLLYTLYFYSTQF